MIRTRNWAFATALLAGVGCQPPPKPAPPAPPPAPWKAPASRTASTAELLPLADQFDQQVAKLPGKNGNEHRVIIVDLLGQLAKILQLVNGPEQSPAFANRVGVVQMAHDVVADEEIPRPRMEASENEALLAAVDALDEVSTRYLFDDDKLPDLVKTARDKVSAALQTQGPMHDLDASAAFTVVKAIVQEQTIALNERFGPSATPTTVPGMPTSTAADLPTTEQAAVPPAITPPSTEPAAPMPATAPAMP